MIIRRTNEGMNEEAGSCVIAVMIRTNQPPPVMTNIAQKYICILIPLKLNHFIQHLSLQHSDSFLNLKLH